MNPETPPTPPKANIIHEESRVLGSSIKKILKTIPTIETPNNIDDIFVTLAKVIRFPVIIFHLILQEGTK